MRDLQALLQQTQEEFGLDPERFREKEEKIKNISSAKDLERLNDSDRIRKKLAQLGGDDIVLERIIGGNNLMDIYYLQRGLEVAKTVCRIVAWPEKWKEKEAWGTGFLVGPGLLMTNNHVIPKLETGRQLFAEFEFEWGKTGLNEATTVFRLDPDTFFMTSAALDYSLVAVQPEADNAPEKKLEQYGWNTLAPMGEKIFDGQFLTIIQHPLGMRKMIAFRENQLVEVEGHFVHYTTDTQKGSSGSLVANDEWEIIALHRRGIPEKDEEGNILLTKGGIWKSKKDTPFISWIANQGVLIDDILADMAKREPQGVNADMKKQLLADYRPEKKTGGYQLPNRKEGH